MKMDLIDRTELKKRLCNSCDISDDICKNILHATCEKMDIIDKMPTVSYMNWISVNKKLPEDTCNGEIYLVTYKFKRKNGSTGYDVSTAFFTNNLHELDKYDFPDESHNRPGWYDYDSEAGFYEIDTDPSKTCGRKVIAWMPLPEPYHEEEEE